MDPTLAYDIGMHNGDDAAYYLHKGLRVVAVEADPSLVAAAEKRFAAEIKQGRLEILPVAIAERQGQAEFWICDELRVWNSFDKASASRLGLPCHSIQVKTTPLRSLFSEYGVPFYLKLDIEGFDHVAASQILEEDPPQYASLEINSAHDFYLLKAKGYRHFKVIQQGCFKQALAPRLSYQELRRATMTRIKSTPWANRTRALYRRIRPSVGRQIKRSGWTFPPDSSGPIGEDTDGTWQTFEAALHAWLSQMLGDQLGYRVSSPGISVWYDLHAKLA